MSFAPVVNGLSPVDRQTDIPAFTPQHTNQLTKYYEDTETVSTLRTQHPIGGMKSPLASPVPQQANRSPVLWTTLSHDNLNSKSIQEIPCLQEVASNQQLQFRLPPLFEFVTTPSIIFGDAPLHNDPEDRLSTRIWNRPSGAQFDSNRSTQAEFNIRRESLFARQEKLLHDELTLQERERQAKVDLAEQQRKDSVKVAQKRTLERHLLRQKQAALLETQKMAIREREYALDEERKRKVQRERIVEFYADEITKSIMQEHILEVDASVLATAFHRKTLLTRVLHHLKKVCGRSLYRKQAAIEQIAKSRIRKSLLTLALAELDSGEHRLTKRSRLPDRLREHQGLFRV